MNKRCVFTMVIVVLFTVLLVIPCRADVPLMVNYQGLLLDQSTGDPVTGSVDMEFRIYDAATGGTLLWSETHAAVNVSDGVYNVVLGAVNPLDPGDFTSPDRWLEVWVEGEQFTPRQRCTSVLFAINADRLDGLDAGAFAPIDHNHDARYVNEGQANAISSAMIIDGAVTEADLGSNSVSTTEVVDDSLTAADLAADAVGQSELASNSVGSDEIINGAVTAADLQDGAALSEILDDDGPGSGLNADFLDGFNSSYFMPASTDNWVNETGDTMTGSLKMNTTGSSIFVDANPSNYVIYGLNVKADQSSANNYPIFGLYSDTDSEASTASTYGTYSIASGNSYTYGVYGSGSSNSGPAYGLVGSATLPSSNTHNSYGLWASGTTNGTGSVYGAYDRAYHSGNSGASYGTYSYASGSDTGIAYGIYAKGYKTSSDTNGTAYGGYFIGENKYSSGASFGVYSRANGTGGTNYGVYATAFNGTTNYAGYFSASSGTGVYAYSGASNKHAGEFYSSNSVGLTGAALYAHAYNTGNGGIAFWAHNDHSTSTDATAVLSNDGTGPLLKGFGGNGGEDEFRFDNDGGLRIYNSHHTQIFYLDPNEDSNGGSIKLYNSVGDLTIELDSGYAGSDGRIITDELQITGGSDLSEQFDIEECTHDIKPGMLVSIDPKRPGKLTISTHPYDNKVAGVISGAGGIKPGMLMGQRNTKADGAYPVALSGRVYCWADTSNGPIKVGDLLTTSKTPGHAMKATDRNRAFGAIIGKAMTPLEKGRGLILVLVSMQ